MNLIGKTATLFLILLGSYRSALAQDWPQWRGPLRDGAASGVTMPASFPEQLSLQWKTEAGGGHATPVVAGQRIYLHSRKNEQEVVSSYDLNSGKLLWKDAYAVPYTPDEAAKAHGMGPFSTPLVANGKLYTLGISGILSCYQSASGKLQWRKEFSQRFKKTWPEYGTATSPLLDGGLLITYAGGKGQGALLAFEAATGRERWSWTGDGPGYCSPIIVNMAGVRQVVILSEQNIISVRLTDGALLWRIPYKTEWDNSIVTPIAYRDTLIFAAVDKGVMAVRPVKRADAWTVENVWRTEEVDLYMNSPVLHGDFLYGLSDKRKGQYFCLDARTGALRWATEGREGENAAIVKTGAWLFLLNNDAQLRIVRASENKYDEVKRYTVASSPTWAHPVLLNNSLLIKDANTLALWKLK